MPIPFPLAGQTVTIKEENGQFSHDGMQLDPGTESELKQMLDQDTRVLPDQPVGPGDTWQIDPQKVAEAWGVDPTKVKMALNLKLTQLRQQDNRQVADIEFNADMTGSMPGVGGGEMSGE